MAEGDRVQSDDMKRIVRENLREMRRFSRHLRRRKIAQALATGGYSLLRRKNKS